MNSKCKYYSTKDQLSPTETFFFSYIPLEAKIILLNSHDGDVKS